jgi:bifunctional non-homologous end joining protein LigD
VSLIELDGKDLRREPIERRKVLLIRLLAKASVGLQANNHIVNPGDVVFRHACQLGFEGIVSKRLTLPFRALPALDQEQESKTPSSEARS